MWFHNMSWNDVVDMGSIKQCFHPKWFLILRVCKRTTRTCKLALLILLAVMDSNEIDDSWQKKSFTRPHKSSHKTSVCLQGLPLTLQTMPGPDTPPQACDAMLCRVDVCHKNNSYSHTWSFCEDTYMYFVPSNNLTWNARMKYYSYA